MQIASATSGVLGVLDVRPGQEDPVPHDVVLAGHPGFRVVLFQRQHADGERVVPEAALGGTYPDDRDRVLQVRGVLQDAGAARLGEGQGAALRACLSGVEQPLPLSASLAGPPEPQFAGPGDGGVPGRDQLVPDRRVADLQLAACKPGIALGQELVSQRPPLGGVADLDLPGVPVDRPVGRDVGVVAGVQVRA